MGFRNALIIGLSFLSFFGVYHSATSGFWKSYESSCYFISTSSELYSVLATVQCTKLGGYLVEINTLEEHNQVTANLKEGEDYWVGLEKNESGVFVWIHDRSKPLVTWDFMWTSDGGNMARYRYTVLNGWALDDRNRPADFRYICEKPRVYSRVITCTKDVTVPIDLQNRPTSLSSTYMNAPHVHGSDRASDGDILTCAMSDMEDDSWWQIDLHDTTFIYGVDMEFRECCDYVIQHYTVQTFITDPKQDNMTVISYTCISFEFDLTTGTSIALQCRSFTAGRYLRITKMASREALVLCDVRIRGTICTDNITALGCSDKAVPNYYIFNFVDQSTDYSLISATTSSAIELPMSTTNLLDQSCLYNTVTETSVIAFCSENLHGSAFITMETHTKTPDLTTGSYNTGSIVMPSMIDSSVIPSPSQVISSQALESSTSVDEIEFNRLIQTLKVNLKETKSYQRTLISAEDNRLSSRVSGYIGILVLVFVLGVLLFFDILKCCRFLSQRFKSK